MKKLSIIQKAAFDTLEIEAHTLGVLQKNSINADFCTAVQAIFEMQGRLVVTGIGKSAIIAQKIVSTLNSTGTSALFLHAADAMHGDMGMIQNDDVVLCISKSGETPEIRILAPLIKNLGSCLIAMTANEQSTLAKLADYTCFTPIQKEADPNNLAPTSSTIAQMALGDAMAMALLALRGFSSSDFAKFHPGGALGKQLYLRVSDLSDLHEKPTVQPHTPLKDVIVEMSSKRLGVVAVTDRDGQLEGIITDGDLRRMLEQRTDLGGIVAADIMSQNPKTILPTAMAIDALTLLRKHSISQILVVDIQGYFTGVLHLHDLIREGII